MAREVELRERVAVAAGTADLTPTGPAADVIGAMGAAAMVRRFDPDLGRMAGRVTKSGTPWLSDKGRLASLLERAKFAGDRKAEHSAALLFAHVLGKRRSWCNRQRMRPGNSLLIALAGIVVVEWIKDRCPQCGGSGRVTVGNVHARNVKTEQCGVCSGGGRPEVEHGSRARALGISMAAYDAHWKARIDEVRCFLLEIEVEVIERLRSQMRSGTLRPVSG